ncbi:hypothetical protein [Phormidesmis sp. 146-33]
MDAPFFEEVETKVANKQARTQILKLRAANWSMLFQKNYVERDQQGEALEKALRLSQANGISLMLIRGEPGAGKTALLRWLAYELFDQGKRLFYKKSQNKVGWLDQLREFSEEAGGKHFYVIADDLFRDEPILEELQQNEFLFPLTLIGTTRQNEDQHHDLQGLDYEIICLDLDKPSADEKERVLALPEVQSHLAGKSAAERQQLMDSPIMLVLMLQLSEGKPFHVLLQDIVKALSNTERQPLYQAFGVLCSFFQYGIIVPFEILKFCLPPSSSLERSILSGLEGLIDTAAYGEYEGLIPVHELIAKTVMTLNYRPNNQHNQPYGWNRPPLLEQHLSAIVQKLDVTQKLQRWWVSITLRKLAGQSGAAALVCKILQDSSPQIAAIKQHNTISDWVTWGQIYIALGDSEEQRSCIRSILQAQPESPLDRTYWLSFVEKFGSWKQQQTAITQTEVWLNTHTHSDTRNVRQNYLGLVEQQGNWEQQQVAIAQTQVWLNDHPDDGHVRQKYLGLLEQCGNQEQQQVAITQTQLWLNEHPGDWHVRQKYLGLLEQRGNREQQQAAITQTQLWLNEHPGDWHVRQKYLGLLEQRGNREQQQAAITQTRTWLDEHSHDGHVRQKYLALLEQRGSREQQQAAIAQTQLWLNNYENNENVRQAYLALVEQRGTWEQQQVAIAQTQLWLDNHPDNGNVRTKYLALVGKIGKNNDAVELVIHQQWQWITQQNQVEQGLWLAFLPVLYHHASPDLYQPAFQLALKQYPDARNLTLNIFGYFRDYLDAATCYHLATRINQYDLPVNKWQNFVHVANFFRDRKEFDTAESIYHRLIGAARRKVRESPELQKTIDFATLSYAQLLLLTKPSQPDQALKKLDPILKKNPKHGFGNLLMAQSYQAKGAPFYIRAKKHFETAIQSDREQRGFFHHQFGCFYRYAVGDMLNARRCFEQSLAQKLNLPASIELAELEVAAKNLERAKTLLENGLDLTPITRPEQEEREKLKDRITALRSLLNIPESPT